jgi:hypothetical protein
VGSRNQCGRSKSVIEARVGRNYPPSNWVPRPSGIHVRLCRPVVSSVARTARGLWFFFTTQLAPEGTHVSGRCPVRAHPLRSKVTEIGARRAHITCGISSPLRPSHHAASCLHQAPSSVARRCPPSCSVSAVPFFICNVYNTHLKYVYVAIAT